MLLSRILGGSVRAGGRRLGRVADLGVVPGVVPIVSGIVVAHRGRARAWAPGESIDRLSAAGVDLRSDVLLPVPAGVLLARDVLDAQMLDLEGRRIVRVGDVDLDRTGDGSIVVTGVEAGLDSVLARLGLRRLAAHVRRETIAWDAVHLPAHPGATLTIDRARPALAGLGPAEHRRLSARLGAHVVASLWHAPHQGLARRFPTHRVRRRRAQP